MASFVFLQPPKCPNWLLRPNKLFHMLYKSVEIGNDVRTKKLRTNSVVESV